MSDNVSSMIMPMLNQISGRLTRMDEKLDVIIDDVQNLKTRMSHVEEGLAGVNRRIDNVDLRLSRVEKRLDLTEQNSFAEMAEKFKDS